MARFVKNWSADEKVEDAQVAPHRYLYNSSSAYRDGDYKEFMAGVPYKEGEVVYVESLEAGTPCAKKVAKRARIVYVWPDRDRFGDRREKFGVQFETKKGLWSKQILSTWPGYIQRGYQLAGLAPDCDEADRLAEEYKAKMKAAKKAQAKAE